MATTEPSTVLIGVFADQDRARRFVERLKDAGFNNDEIGVVVREQPHSTTQVEEGAAAGALTGGMWGALLGAAVITGLLPGFGVIVAGGLLAGIASGAAVGAAAGGAIGALIGLGLPEEKARHLEQQLHAGRTLVIVKSVPRMAEARAILAELQEEEAAQPPVDHFDDEGLEKLDDLL